ncbi:hypothetical protein [Fictibacillus nanhaiensis]|jgi:hypothetical protein|uniref:hypothetical protein n=1 Tax=Fictibacillus nanhaiensis TaxID=742169 RepID=UPI003C1C6445
MLNSQKYIEEIAEEIHCCGSSLNVKGVIDVDRSELVYFMTCKICKGTIVLKDQD